LSYGLKNIEGAPEQIDAMLFSGNESDVNIVFCLAHQTLERAVPY